jgi:predicted nucleotidyltransferase
MLEEILNSKPKVKILKLLVNKSDWLFSESEISRELKIPKTTTHRTLKTLREQNILREFKKAGKIVIYQLNKDNYIIRELIEPFLKKDSEIIIKKSKEFCQKINKLIKVAILFGSSSKGEMKPTSDVDIALITEKPQELEKIVNKIKTEFLESDSIIFSTHIFTKKEFKVRYEKKDPLVIDIVNGYIIFGDIEEVI